MVGRATVRIELSTISTSMARQSANRAGAAARRLVGAGRTGRRRASRRWWWQSWVLLRDGIERCSIEHGSRIEHCSRMSSSTLWRPVGCGAWLPHRQTPIAPRRPRAAARSPLQRAVARSAAAATAAPPTRSSRSWPPRSRSSIATAPRASRCADSPQSWAAAWAASTGTSTARTRCSPSPATPSSARRWRGADANRRHRVGRPVGRPDRPDAPETSDPVVAAAVARAPAHRARALRADPAPPLARASSCRPRERAHPTRCASGSGSADPSPPWG